MNNAAVAAIQFALEANHQDGSGIDFLRCWNEADFEACRREWPEAPEDCYIGADPLHPKTAKDIVSWEFQSALRDVADERRRQVFQEGFDATHDSQYQDGELAAAAGAYALCVSRQVGERSRLAHDPSQPPAQWPFDEIWWKPGDAQRTLIKALALGFAQLECLKRMQAAQAPSARTVA